MATIHDVAEHAGVSPTTVSRYLNNRIDLPAATAARIDAAILKLEYRPNLLAKRLSTGKTEALGLVGPEIREPFFGELASAVENEADRHGYSTFISSTRNDPERELAAIRKLQDRHVDGLIMMTNTRDDGTLAALIGQCRHVVLVDEDVPGADAPRILVENERGAYEATRHLIEAGHEDIAFLGGPPGLLTVEERRSGYLRALGEAGLAVRGELIRLGSYDVDFGRAAVDSLLEDSRPPTAVFASGNALVAGTVGSLRAHGLSMPDDMSLVGFDDLPSTDLLEPALTAVHQPIEGLGRQGVITLMALIAGNEPPAITRLPVTLHRRASVAAPHRRQGMGRVRRARASIDA